MEFKFNERELELLYKYVASITILELENEQLTNKEILELINKSDTNKFTFDELVKIINALLHMTVIQLSQ
ncbi:MAG: hypothetical protein ACYDAO_09990 [Thermoplasmataceae archaeon]